VVKIRLLFDDLLSRIVITSSELKGADIISQEEGGQKELTELRDTIRKKSRDAEVQATAVADGGISDKKNEMKELRIESQKLQQQIESLVTKKADVDDMVRQIGNDVDKLENEKSQIVAEVREKFAKSSEDVEQRIGLYTDIKSKIAESKEVRSGRILDVETLAKLTIIHQELEGFVRVSKESDRKDLIEDVRKTIGEFELGVPDVGHGTEVKGNEDVQVNNAEFLLKLATPELSCSKRDFH
jgi:uncharacterized phage infection (PIP) family protein YhgE